VRDEIVGRLESSARKAKSDVTVVEIGGTLGDFSNALFIDAARVMHLKHPADVLFVMVSYLPVPSKVGEMKSKPTQYAIRTLNSAGIQADFVLCRAERALDDSRKRKIAISGSVSPDHIISAPDVDSIYEIPLYFDGEQVGEKIMQQFGLKRKKSTPGLGDWQKLVNKIKTVKKEVRIGIVGKYFKTGDFVLKDSYISVIEAVKHAAWRQNLKPIIEWLNADDYETAPKQLAELKKFDGVIVPGGFGGRGTEGKIAAIQYLRKNKIPFFGLCYGMQLAAIEFARHVCGLKGASSTEIDPKTDAPVIHVMP